MRVSIIQSALLASASLFALMVSFISDPTYLTVIDYATATEPAPHLSPEEVRTKSFALGINLATLFQDDETIDPAKLKTLRDSFALLIDHDVKEARISSWVGTHSDELDKLTSARGVD